MSEVQPTEIKTITSLEQINQIIKRKDVSYASHYMVPSLKKEVPFNEINTSQQKRLVKSVIDSPIYNTEFIYTLHDILKENCQEPTINIDNLTIIDKLVLAIGLRIKSIGSTIETEITTKENKNVKVNLELPKILEEALNTLQNIAPEFREDDYFRVECSIPTIGSEYNLEKELRSKPQNEQIETMQDMRQIAGDAFVSEIVKYISNVSVKNENKELIPVDWQRFNYADRIKILETFKTGLLKDIINYADKVSTEIDKIELIRFEFEGETYERRLSIDSRFFTIS